MEINDRKVCLYIDMIVIGNKQVNYCKILMIYVFQFSYCFLFEMMFFCYEQWIVKIF